MTFEKTNIVNAFLHPKHFVDGSSSFTHHSKRQLGVGDIHLADLLGEEVHVVETVVVGWFMVKG